MRSLAFDLGRALGVGGARHGARPDALGAVRAGGGAVRSRRSSPLWPGRRAAAVALPSALGHLPALRVGPDAARDIAHGWGRVRATP